MGLVAIACGLIVALGALGASIGIAMVGSNIWSLLRVNLN